MAIETGRAAREELWRRYDAGVVTASELDARLVRVDRAGDDPAELAAALDGPVGRAYDLGTNRRLILAAIVVAVAVFLLSSIVWLVRDGDDPGTGARTTATGNAEPVPVPLPLPLPPGADPEADCAEGDDAVAAMVAIDTPAENPALLSDPAALPEGYDVAEEDTIAVGTDPNIAMAVYSGIPNPVEILGRDVAGPLLVTMRAFRYESPDAAKAAAEGVVRTGVCNYDLQGFSLPDRPEITGAVVQGVIPTTAFASFRIGDRRVVVAVPSDGDGDAAIAEAQDLAGLLAGLELDAARTPPPPG